jgi:hypothetical protein
MSSVEQVTARKLSAISYQLSAFSGAMTASSSPRLLLVKAFDSQLDPTGQDHMQEGWWYSS